MKSQKRRCSALVTSLVFLLLLLLPLLQLQPMLLLPLLLLLPLPLLLLAARCLASTATTSWQAIESDLEVTSRDALRSHPHTRSSPP